MLVRARRLRLPVVSPAMLEALAVMPSATLPMPLTPLTPVPLAARAALPILPTP